MYIQCTFRRSGGFGFGQYVLFPAKLNAITRIYFVETPVSQGIHIVRREKKLEKKYIIKS